MADSGIKKVIIPKSSLPDVTKDNQFLLRYRIVSEDKNRVSSWSPVFKLDAPPPIALEESQVTYSINNRLISLAWQEDVSADKYDIFVRFDGQEEYQYHGTANTTSYMLISQGVSSFQFAIQVPSISKTRNTQLERYESEVISLV